MKNFSSAVMTYEEAIETDNKNYEAYYKLGWLQVKHEKIKEGTDNLMKAVSLA